MSDTKTILKPRLAKKARRINRWLELVIPYMDIVKLPEIEITTERRDILRHEFSMVARGDFLVWLSKTHPEDVKFLGMNIRNLIARANFRRNHPEQWGELVRRKNNKGMGGINLGKHAPRVELEGQVSKDKPATNVGANENNAVESQKVQNLQPPAKTPEIIKINREEKMPLTRQGNVTDNIQTIAAISPAPLSRKWDSCSIDHIIPYRFGGTNDVGNLCIIPNWINQLKMQFEDTQRKIDPYAQETIILLPKRISSGEYETVPRFPDNFYSLEPHKIKSFH